MNGILHCPVYNLQYQATTRDCPYNGNARNNVGAIPCGCLIKWFS